MSQQSLFDQDPETATEERARQSESGMRLGPNRGPDHPAFDDDEDDVATYMRRKRNQELRERAERRQQEDDLWAGATDGLDYAGRLHCWKWAINTDWTATLQIERDMLEAAKGIRGRLKAFERAKDATLDPGDQGYVGWGEEWPFDEPLGPPKWNTKKSDYQRDHIERWFRNWRHALPTDVLEDAQDADPSFL